MLKKIALTCALGITCCTSISAFANSNAAWEKICKKDQKTCIMVQNIKKSVTSKNGKKVDIPLLQVQISRHQTPKITFLTQTGVDLRAGLAMQIDQNKQAVIPFIACNRYFCMTSFTLSDQTITSLKSGHAMSVKFAPLGRKPIENKISLTGFTKVYNSIK